MKLSPDELARMNPKGLKDPAVVELYQAHPFIEAYGLHTDRRVLVDGYKGAVGNRDDWDAHGRLQFAFLRAIGLEPRHHLLEIGCGTGRLARHVVPYLDPGRYAGVDISLEAVRAAMFLSGAEGWSSRLPLFLHAAYPRGRFNFAWAYSVFIHLPPDEITAVMREVAARLAPSGRFYWSFVPERVTLRTGLKQFRATRDVYAACAAAAGLTFDASPGWIELAGYEPSRWTGSQHVALSMLRQ